jgi:two-component system OmpR family sensor kinase
MRLALRATLIMALALAAVSVVSLLLLRSVLDGQIDATILEVAAIQAASLTDEQSGDMRFHDWELTPDEVDAVQDLVRYAQVWQADGLSLLRSQYMTSDLPLDSERLGAVHQRHVLQVAAPLRSRNALLTSVGAFLALLSIAVTASAFGGSWWLAGRAMRPVHEIMDQAEEIGVGSLERRIHAYADTREYQRLVDVLNTMLERIQGAFEVQRRFTSDASHELRSPLTAMRGELELALRRERDLPEYRRVVESTLEEVVRLSRITEDLLILARSDSGALVVRPEPVDVAGAVERVLERLRGKAAAKGVALESDVVGDTTAEVDPVLLGQTAWNLLENAIRFTPAGGRIRVVARGDAERVELLVEDSGPGFPPEMLDRVFDRFFRADPARSRPDEVSGTGLGLAIVKGVAEAHHGTAEAANVPDGGARVTVRLPRRAPQQA